MYDLDFGFRKESRSGRTASKSSQKRVCEFPPSNQVELLASLLEYMASDSFNYPITASLLNLDYSTQNENFKRFQERLAELDFNLALESLAEKGVVQLKKTCVGRKMDTLILDVDNEVLRPLLREYFDERPKRMPELNIQRDQGRELTALRKKLDQSTLDRQRLLKIMSEPTAIKKELKKSFEELQMQKYFNSQTAKFSENLIKEFKNEICKHETRQACYNATGNKYCDYRHYYKLLLPHTKEQLGLCLKEKYSSICEINKCQYVHLATEEENMIPFLKNVYLNIETKNAYEKSALPSQWINCDLRFLDYSILGKFDAIMLDPPWDIHMNLPYGTLKDKEMKALRVREMQDNGICFLWVTGRALELGRECLQEWGYKRVEELVWIKINPLGKIVRTGRTGHWLNHSKEPCLIGVKGDTSRLKRNLDTDVLLAEVRETSRKPDEIYSIIERVCPGGRKVELFARPHNRRTGWVSLGNQLPGIYLVEEDVIERFNERYSDITLTKELMEKYKNIETDDKNFINTVYFNHLFRQQK